MPSALLFLSTWLAGGLLAFAGADGYAELGRCGRAQAANTYLRDASGPIAGFLTGWTSFVAGFSGAMAASAIVLALYLDRFFPGAASSTALFVVPIP